MTRDADRQAALAAALRANLKRRKAASPLETAEPPPRDTPPKDG